MRRYFVVWCIVVLSFIVTGCDQQAKEQNQPLQDTQQKQEQVPKPAVKAAANGPRIQFEGQIHDFGEVAPTSSNVYSFKFTNTGDKALEIKKVTKTCGCTPYSLDKKNYAPGETGELKVKYNAGSSSGMVTRHLYVYSNDEDNEKVELTLKAHIIEKVKHTPHRLNLSLKQENAGCPDIVIQSLDGKEFSIKRIKSTADCIAIDFDPEAKSKEFILKPKVDMEKLKRGLIGRIDISLTHPQCRTKTISFEALPRFKSTPPSIIAFNAKPNVPEKRKIYILSNYNEDFDVESVTSENGIVKIISQKKQNNRYAIEIEIIPPEVESKLKHFKDVITVKIKDAGALNISCRGFYARTQKKPAEK